MNYANLYSLPIIDQRTAFEKRVDDLLALTNGSVFTKDDFLFFQHIVRECPIYQFDIRRFFFCMDWRYLYFSNPPMEKLTLYDIFVNTPIKDKKENKTTGVLFVLKGSFDGEFETQVFSEKYSFKKMRDTILDVISIGLKGYNVDKGARKKGIHELIRHIFTELASVDYEFDDFKKPYLDKPSRKSKVYDNVFDRFTIANIFNEFYKKQFGLQVLSMQLSESAISHILLRHTIPCKIYSRNVSNRIYNRTIKNGLGDDVLITAYRLDEYMIGVIGDDGEFHLPSFSTKEDDYFQFLCSNKYITKQIIEESTYNLHQMLCKIVEILERCYNRTKTYSKQETPHIIYLNGELYGVEIERENRNIETFFPLNSEYQQKNGILRTDYNNIINPNDMPDYFRSSLKIID